MAKIVFEYLNEDAYQADEYVGMLMSPGGKGAVRDCMTVAEAVAKEFGGCDMWFEVYDEDDDLASTNPDVVEVAWEDGHLAMFRRELGDHQE